MTTLVQHGGFAGTVIHSLSGIAQFFGDVARAGHAAAKYQHLASLNDRQLASRGVGREEAARAAFEDSFGKL